jgi:hypothetical protein
LLDIARIVNPRKLFGGCRPPLWQRALGRKARLLQVGLDRRQSPRVLRMSPRDVLLKNGIQVEQRHGKPLFPELFSRMK